MVAAKYIYNGSNDFFFFFAKDFELESNIYTFMNIMVFKLYSDIYIWCFNPENSCHLIYNYLYFYKYSVSVQFRNLFFLFV